MLLIVALVSFLVGYVAGMLHGRALTKPRATPEWVSTWERDLALEETHMNLCGPYRLHAPVIINATQYNRGGPCS